MTACNSWQGHQTKPTPPNPQSQATQTKPAKPNLPKPNLANQAYWTNLPNQTHQTKSNLAYQAYWTKPIKPKLLVKGVNAWVRSAFGNVYIFSSTNSFSVLSIAFVLY